MILREVSAGERVNKNNGRRWIEPDETLKRVHDGFACAECLNSYYTCLCSHEE
mgnify:FL=1